MITPTIGRVVWYNCPDYVNVQPHAAIVTFVHSDTRINIAAFDSNGNSYPVTSVFLWQGEGERPVNECFAEWMPYQKGQAQKTEQLEKQLASK